MRSADVGYTVTVRSDLESILITRNEIARRVEAMADAISNDLGDLDDGGEVTLVPVLAGSMIFVADLMRHLPYKLRIELVTVSSYPGDSTESRGAQLVGSLPDALDGRHVLVIDDILDSGATLSLIRAELARRRPASLRTCVLLRKDRPSAKAVPCDYVGFDIPDLFVVGYGLDHDNYYRNLPEIGVLKAHAAQTGRADADGPDRVGKEAT